jgi:type II secretory pathway pseudopilin PulG
MRYRDLRRELQAMMMNHNSDGPHHNIWTERTGASGVRFRKYPSLRRHDEAGYTLVALLALMTILALLALAAAPSLQQQARRESEKEAIFRGEEVAEAIRRYYSYQATKGITGDAALPTSIDQLIEGVSVGTKKVQILRGSAARDPLSESGDWHLVRPRSNELADFQRSVMLFAQNVRPPTNDPQLKLVELLMAPPVLPTLDVTTSARSSDSADDIQGPFIGVSSGNKTNSVLYYYGIDHHDGWIFTPLFR